MYLIHSHFRCDIRQCYDVTYSLYCSPLHSVLAIQPLLAILLRLFCFITTDTAVLVTVKYGDPCKKDVVIDTGLSFLTFPFRRKVGNTEANGGRMTNCFRAALTPLNSPSFETGSTTQ